MKVANHKIQVMSLFLVALFVLAGCASVKEGARGVIGISTKQIEEAKKDAIVKTFKYSYDVCLKQVKEILTSIGSYIYTEDKNKNLIAVYVSTTDTTPVGIFFKQIDADNTQLEISSPSSEAKEYIAGKLFLLLEGPGQKKEKERTTNAEQPSY